MKKAIPANGKIAKDAKETVQECVSEFISFITSELSASAAAEFVANLEWLRSGVSGFGWRFCVDLSTSTFLVCSLQSE
jgi:hypothetical protein